MIRYLSSHECKAKLDKIFELACQKFEGDLLYEIDEKTKRRNDSPHTLCAAAYDTEKDEILSYFSCTVSDTIFRDGLLSGKYDDNDLYPYDGSNPPILVFDALIVTNHIHAPFIVHRLIKDLHELVRLDELDIVGGLSIGGLRITEKWLKKYGFREIGRYKEKYPIFWANREESAVLNSITSRAKFTNLPWNSH